MNRLRNRLLILAIIFLVAGFYNLRTDRERQPRPRPLSEDMPGRRIAPAGSPRQGRGAEEASRDGTQQALTRLRSLMELRQGEVAFIRLPPSMMRSILEEKDPALGQIAASSGEEGGLAGFLEREWAEEKLRLLVARGNPIEGTGDSTDDSFGWTTPSWEIRGSTHHIGDTARFRLFAGDEKAAVETIFRAPHGSIALIRVPGSEAEGVLVVVGKGEGAGQREQGVR